MTALMWLVMMVPPSAVLLFGGFRAVKRQYGGWRHMLGIAAVVLGLLLVTVTVVGLLGISVTMENSG